MIEECAVSILALAPAATKGYPEYISIKLSVFLCSYLTFQFLLYKCIYANLKFLKFLMHY